MQLTWDVTTISGCPTKAEVLDSLRQYIGSGPAGGHTSIAAVATIRKRAPEALELTLTTFDGTAHGERVFRDTSCRSLAEAAVVVLAWMIDPDSMAARSQAPHPKQPDTPSPSSPPVATADVAAPQPTSKTWPVYAGGGVDADWGTLPNPAFGSHLRLGLLLLPFRFTTYGKYWPLSRKSLPPRTDGTVPGATFSLWSLGLEACFTTAARRSSPLLALSLCVGPELEVLHGAGFGVAVPAAATKTWLSLAAGVEGQVRLAGPLSVFLGLGATVPSLRERFALRGVAEIYRPRAVAARVQLGAALEL